MLRNLALGFGLLLVVVTTGCGEEELPPPEIVSFTMSGSSVEAGGTMTGTIELMHFTLVEHGGDHGAPKNLDLAGEDFYHGEGNNEGHVHVYLDDLMTNPLAMATTHMFDLTIPAETTAGSHKLIARLHNGDHLIIEPQVTAEVTIDVTDATQ